MNSYDIKDCVKILADAIREHGEARVIAAKIAANSEQRAAGNAEPYREVQP